MNDIEIIRQLIEDGLYDTPECIEQTAKAIIESGDLAEALGLDT